MTSQHHQPEDSFVATSAEQVALRIIDEALNGKMPARLMVALAAKQAENALLRTSQQFSWTYRPPGKHPVPVSLGNLVPEGMPHDNIRTALTILAQTTFTVLVGSQESYSITPETILDLFLFFAEDPIYMVSPSWPFTKAQFKEVAPR